MCIPPLPATLPTCLASSSTTATNRPSAASVFAAFKGHDTPLRHQATIASCAFGGHAIWWTVEADGEAEALALLPYYLAQRSDVTRIGKVDIP
jgi:hypothetical protein